MPKPAPARTFGAQGIRDADPPTAIRHLGIVQSAKSAQHARGVRALETDANDLHGGNHDCIEHR